MKGLFSGKEMMTEKSARLVFLPNSLLLLLVLLLSCRRDDPI